MVSAVDTCVLLDILLADPIHLSSSKALLTKAGAEGALIVCEMVYAELSCQFESRQDLEAFLSATGIDLVRSSRESLYAAALAWRTYLTRRQNGLQCSSCGNVVQVLCPECCQPILSRQHIASDFVIGAHALFLSDRLLTRDVGFYISYYPELKLNA